MKTPSERLWELLPGVYRARDAELEGAPLRRFVEVLGGELDRLRMGVRALADDHFVERASEDGLALLAELLGARLITRDLGNTRGVVYNSVAWRRRRGTLPTLEDLLRVSSGWSAEVDESFRSLLQTQKVDHVLPHRGRTAVLWDPIAVADPLSRNAPSVALPPLGVLRGWGADAALMRREDETLDEALRRTGRADAGRHAASPRTIDFGGWARPDVAIIRSTRLRSLEIEDLDVGTPRSFATLDPERSLSGFFLDPLARDVPLIWLAPLERPDTIPTLTTLHEAPSSGTLSIVGRSMGMSSSGESADGATLRRGATLLTPTALAEDGDRVEAAGGLDVSIDGVQLIGPARVASAGGPLLAAPLGPHPVLRFADGARPGAGDEWRLALIARQPEGDTLLASVRATRDATTALALRAGASTEQLGGATLMLRVRRLAGRGARRSASGEWSAAGDGTRQGPPLGASIAFNAGAGLELWRPELHEASGGSRLARRGPLDAAWSALPLEGSVPASEPGTLLVANGDELWLVAPERDDSGELERMELYRVIIGPDAAVSSRVLAAGVTSPPGRTAAASVVLAGRLYLYGGVQGGVALADLWSIALDGSEPRWRPHPLRNPRPRAEACLVASGSELWLFGGESVGNELESSVWSIDPNAARPRWQERPALPFAAGKPGLLAARRAVNAFEVIAWANSSRPRVHALVDGDDTWQTGGLESDAPNPPAAGQSVFFGDELIVAEPSPLPPSEVVLPLAGESVLAFLPALALTSAPLDVGEEPLDDEADNPGLPGSVYVTYHVGADGSTWIAGAGDEPLHARQGGALHASRAARIADRPRFGIPERLSREFFRLRQRSLGVWNEPLALEDTDVVGLDPRLGRVLLPGNVSRGRVRVSYRVGRPSAIGVGALPPSRALPEHWHEPDVNVPAPPDRRDPPVGIAAWVDPVRAGLPLDDDPTSPLLVPDLSAALSSIVRRGGDGNDEPAPVIGVLRSSSVPPAHLGVASGLSIVATDAGATPLVRADGPGGVSLAVHPERGSSSPVELWLAGLWLEGRLDLALASGEVDVRWCSIGQPGELAIRLPGAGHENALTRRTLPRLELELRLYGCVLSAIEVPPWVRVIAAGCTFDAGSRSAVALAARGADVRLRHCTIHGAVEAGELRASSCAFAGAVRVDRRDKGWLRHSLLPSRGRAPRAYRTLDSGVQFASTSPTSPAYLLLAENNGAVALANGEDGRRPGAHEDRGRRLYELEQRTADFLPISLTPYHSDRTRDDLDRMSHPRRIS